MLFLNDDNTFPITVGNPAADNKPVVYTGVAATLNFKLVNLTGDVIGLQSQSSGANPAASVPSQIEVVMPSYYTVDELKNMTVTDISVKGWSFAYSVAGESLMLTWTGAAGTWANNAALTFQVGNALSTHAPMVDSILVNLDNMSGNNIPPTLYQNLGLNNPTPQKNTDLMKVLGRTLDNQGAVFVSIESDPLGNTVYLNLKNTGTNAIYNSKKKWTVPPQIFVSFVYGLTAGSLAPADKDKSTNTGSAWKISASVAASSGWGYTNPKITDGSNTPSWTLYPNTDNTPVLGTGDQANVTFAFGNIVSLLSPGHTQMYLQFSNFWVDENTPYAPVSVMLDMVKLMPPPTRGILNFFATNGPIVPLTKPTQQIEIELQARLYYVDNVILTCNAPGIPVQKFNYWNNGAAPALQDVTYKITLTENDISDTVVFFTLQAFGNDGGYLNTMQFTVFFQGLYVKDAGGTVYPGVLLNNQVWMAENYRYQPLSDPGVSTYSGTNDPDEVNKYGLLYTVEAAQKYAPPGWRLPTQAEWQALITSFGTGAYTALYGQGSSQFAAVAGGSLQANKKNNGDIDQSGFYWTGTAVAGNNNMAAFYTFTTSVNASGNFPSNYFFSVRYVKI